MLTANINPTVLIIGGAAIFSVMVFFIILFILLYQKRYYRFLREKQQLEGKFHQEIRQIQMETQEETFYQIGEEIHDNIGQLLTSTKLLLSITERSLPGLPDPFHTAQETLAKAIHELRALSKSLNKEWLHQFNLIENLETETARINSANFIKASLVTSTRQVPRSAQDQVVLFRIIQEAIHNSIKHSDAKTVQIMIHLNNGIQIIVSDDGSGLTVDRKTIDGVGIMNMKHRTEVLGGTIQWSSNISNGTDVEINIPTLKMTDEN
jgi:signal transduction histidine kinase